MRRPGTLTCALFLLALGAMTRGDTAGTPFSGRGRQWLPVAELVPPPAEPRALPVSRSAFSSVQEGVWWASNPARGLQVRASGAGVEVASTFLEEPGWRLRLRLVRFGREGAFETAGVPRLALAGSRIELRRSGLTEWYVSDERGLEQGFTVDRAPAGGYARLPLDLELNVMGRLDAVLVEGGKAVLFRTKSGADALRYGGLVVRDARGVELEASLSLLPGGLRIRIQDQGAIYPLTVDPVLAAAWTTESDRSETAFGHAVAGAGDVNGDGFGDVIVGAPFYSDDQFRQGRAYVYLGSASGLLTAPAWMPKGDQEAAHFGWSVASAGDVNGDGYEDIIVGAYRYSNGQFNEGRAALYRGSASGPEPAPSWSAEGEQDDAWFGHSVASAGDVNADGYDDVIVGAPQFDSGQSFQGRAFLYLGSPSGLSTFPAWSADGDRAFARFGFSVATAGSVNGDGFSDVIVGAPGSFDPSHDLLQEGRVLVYLGSLSGLATEPGWDAWGGRRAGSFGASVAAAGDMNGDGRGDVVIGAPGTSGAAPAGGRAVVFLGSASALDSAPAWAVEGTSQFGNQGASVGSAGDFDGDGYADVITGEPGHERSTDFEVVGRVSVFRGSASGPDSSPGRTAESDQAFSGFGLAVAAAGDVDGDGFDDILAGAPEYDGEMGPQQGRVFLYRGLPENRPPVAHASAPAGVECTSTAGAAATLDGRGSTDPDSTPGTNDDIQVFQWFEGETLLGTGEVVEVALPLGAHSITLRVTDAGGEMDTDQVTVEVVDSTSPQISLQLSPSVLWPPGHQMVNVHATVSATDPCGAPGVILVSISSDEPDNAPDPADGNTSLDIQGASPGTADFEFQLRAERSELGDGRTYTVVYRATDGSGNPATATGVVSVPLKLSGGGSPIKPPRPRIQRAFLQRDGR